MVRQHAFETCWCETATKPLTDEISYTDPGRAAVSPRVIFSPTPWFPPVGSQTSCREGASGSSFGTVGVGEARRADPAAESLCRAATRSNARVDARRMRPRLQSGGTPRWLSVSRGDGGSWGRRLRTEGPGHGSAARPRTTPHRNDMACSPVRPPVPEHLRADSAPGFSSAPKILESQAGFVAGAS